MVEEEEEEDEVEEQDEDEVEEEQCAMLAHWKAIRNTSQLQCPVDRFSSQAWLSST